MLRSAFVTFDKDSDGTLSLEEFQAAMVGKIPEKDVNALFQVRTQQQLLSCLLAAGGGVV